ncbi:MAG: hypothetical protein N4A50_01375 [Vallitalea sp.]|jgi:hypothetical protein|nr:hypothetical protein [Vallitalea sp.]
MNFWWGEYGFTQICDEEIFIYKDENCKKLIGCLDIYTRPTLKYIFEEYDESKEYIEKIKTFLAEDKIVYDYIYPRDFKDRLFNQVKHDAPRDKRGLKPTYIMMWNTVECLNVNELKKCAKLYCLKFYGIEVENVEILNIPTYEEVKRSYEEAVEMDRKMGIL